ncbi:ABC transporter substrate-binding protein [Telluribacter sp.]|jgi:ABC-type branched-subunit amino acid transport system substrate-binding protein|uniref:ABC transporter substrate-binding protein n=1 Tax=Telluribacter sp. TaxID=1978767 RepID=UPI002E0E277F|nr:ABC transporter substrate-binding protein [Telluribacter sp.]
MKRILLLLILWGVFGSSISNAQLFDKSGKNYREAIDFYKQGKYLVAMNRLAPLTRTTSSFAPYSHYYYALAAYQLKKYNDSYLMLRQLVSRYPNWERMNDAHYLMGATQLALGNYQQALQSLQLIDEAGLKKDVQGLKQHYLSQITDLNALKNLQKQNAGDKEVAVALVSLIQKKSTDKADLELSDRLTNRFGIESTETVSVKNPTPGQKSPPRTARNWEKGYYNVAVMLPFRLGEVPASRRSRPNQYAYDYYQGMLLAKQQLKDEGILVNLQTYDIGSEEALMRDLVNNNQFRQSDLLIGPLYTNTYEIASKFASENDVLIVNPLSTDGSLLASSNNAYLARPSIEYQMAQAAQLAARLSAGLTAAVYYGTTSKDSAMAAAYTEEIKKKGGKVLEMVRITDQKETIDARMSRFEREKPTHIVLASTDPQSGPALFSVLNGRDLSNVPVIATATSFDFQRSRPHSYGGRLYLLETDYIDLTKDNIKAFRRAYYEQSETLPSVYSYQGYDQLLFLGRMIAKYKDRLSQGLKARQFDEDYLLSGFDFTKSRENQVSPLLRAEGSRWVPVR